MSQSARRNVLVIEATPSVRFALDRVPLGAGIFFSHLSLEDALGSEEKFAAILADDSALLGPGEELPITVLKRQFHCPIILMTSTGNRRVESYARGAGASAVLFKPFRMGELRRQIWKTVTGEEAPDVGSDVPVPAATAESSGVSSVFTPADYGSQIAGEGVFDAVFSELERRQPLQEGLDAFDVVERHLIKRALQACDGNQSRAARFLGITRNTLRKRIRKYGFGGLLAGDETADDEDS